MQLKCYVFPASSQVYNADRVLIASDMNVVHWLSWCLLDFSAVTVTVFPFVVDNHLRGDIWRQYKPYPLSLAQISRL